MTCSMLTGTLNITVPNMIHESQAISSLKLSGNRKKGKDKLFI